MNKTQAIAKLEALLSRVRTRASAPRVADDELPTEIHARHEPPAPAPAAAAPEPQIPAAFREPPTELSRLPDMRPPAPTLAPDQDYESPPDIEPVAARSEPPASVEILAEPPRSGPSPTEAEVVLEVDVQSVSADAVLLSEDVPLLSVPAEEVAVPEALASSERLVAAAPVADAPAVSIEAPVDAPDDLLADLGDVQEAPASSRRPMSPAPEEQLAELAFGAADAKPPRHTPPPESGRLPAAPDEDFDGDVTGVREAPVKAPPGDLIPEVTLPALGASDEVAEVVGTAPRPQPATFVALLEASIAL